MKKNLLALTIVAITFSLPSQSAKFSWVKAFGNGASDTYSQSIISDDSNYVYALGYFQYTVDFDPGAATYNLGSSGYYDVFLEKLDPSGNFVWVRKFGGKLQEDASSLNIDVSGNIYITGSFQDTVDFDPGPGINKLVSAGVQDIFICKLDPGGNFIWAKNMGGNSTDVAFSITTDKAGNVYTTGIFNNTADFNPSATGTANLTSQGDKDIFISKLDSSGNFIWAKSVGGANTDYGYSLKTDTAQNVYITGFFQSTADFDPGAAVMNLTSNGLNEIYLLKLDVSGNFVWAESFGGIYNDEGNSLTLDRSGNILITGGFFATADFDPGASVFNLNSAGDYDIFIAKINNSGNLVWAKRIGDYKRDIAVSITTDTSGNIYTTGNFQASVDFDPGPGSEILTSSPWQDIFISKLDASGNFIMAKSFKGHFPNYGRAININSSGNIYSTGYFADTCDFDPGAGEMILTTFTSTYRAYVHKMVPCTPSYSIVNLAACDSLVINGKIFRTTGVYQLLLSNSLGCDSIMTLNLNIYHLNTTVTKSGSVLTSNTSGAKYQWVQCPNYSILPNDTQQSFTATSTGNYAVIISSGVCKDTSLCYPVNGLGLTNHNISIPDIYPNPFTDQFNITLQNNSHLSIYNSLGELIYDNELGPGINSIHFSSNAPGIYFIRLSSEGSVLEATIMKIR